MSFAKHFPAATWIGRTLTGPIARLIYLSLVLSLVPLSIALHLNSFLQTRQFQKVLAGLRTVRIDETTEEELLRQVPHLQLSENSAGFGLNRERWYFALFTNESAWSRLERLAIERPGQRFPRQWMLAWARRLGFRYMRLWATVIVLDGKVSNISYGVASEYAAPQVLGNLVMVRSAHGYWLEHRFPLYQTSVEDQSPGYRIRETVRHPLGFETIESSLSVSYSFDADPETIAHVFQADLSCFWSIRGCHSGREILPLTWQDKLATDKATLARLESNDPCPDSVLEGRVRYLPDVDVSLVEVTTSGAGRISPADGVLYWSPTSTYKFRVLEVLQGQPPMRTVQPFLQALKIPSPVDPRKEITDPSAGAMQKGGHLILFGNYTFESCSVVPATDSAEAAIRATKPAPRRREDQVIDERWAL